MSPIDERPDELAVLEAIDATLAGEPVDPIHAEMAELALLLSDERPGIDANFAAALDGALERRFAPVPSARSPRPQIARALHRRWWLWTPAAGMAVALIAAIVVVAAGGSGRPKTIKTLSASAGSRAAAPDAAHRSASAPAPSSSASVPSSAFGPGFQPPSNGRKVIQSAQLTLSAAPARLEAVAQEVFNAVGQYKGIVNSSNVTATNGPAASAQFQLSIPSSALPQAMASLSTLRYAHVASRTDSTQDVNGRYQSDVRALADARARRTSLLKQLASATTQAQIDSLTARIHDAEASISSDEAALRGLNHQIDYSQVDVTINGGAVAPVPARSSGFGIGRAAHDAGRVLTVAAGIALIGLAALLPVGLVAALIWWIASLTRRRRREHALDLV